MDEREAYAGIRVARRIRSLHHRNFSERPHDCVYPIASGSPSQTHLRRRVCQNLETPRCRIRSAIRVGVGSGVPTGRGSVSLPATRRWKRRAIFRSPLRDLRRWRPQTGFDSQTKPRARRNEGIAKGSQPSDAPVPEGPRTMARLFHWRVPATQKSTVSRRDT